MKAVKFLAVLMLGIFMASAPVVAYATDDPGTVKQEIKADKEAIKTQRETMKSNAESAKAEEQALRGEVKEARQAGDAEKTEALKEQLKKTHKENVAGRKQDKKALHKAKQEMGHDTKAARKAAHDKQRP